MQVKISRLTPRGERKKKAPKSRLRCIDLFAGAGGFSLAAKSAGMDVVAAIESDTHACKTYRRNIVARSGVKLYESDITQLDPQKVAEECFSDAGGCDLVLGGPPCQGFSVHRIKGAGTADPRNALIHTYFQFVSALRPRAFLLENVPGLLWPRHALHLEKFYREADEAGYKVLPPVTLDARDFGVPQRRKRVFILGVRKGIDIPDDWAPKATHARSPKLDRTKKKKKKWVSCRKVFKVAKKGDLNNIHMNHSSALVEIFKKTPANGGSRKDSGRVLPCHKEHDGHKDVYGRIDPSKPAPTMTTACINPSKGRFVHPVQHHGITLRQAARIQTFPETFVFEGGLIAAGVQIGNAVPVLLGKILLRRVTQLLAAVETAQCEPQSAIEYARAAD